MTKKKITRFSKANELRRSRRSSGKTSSYFEGDESDELASDAPARKGKSMPMRPVKRQKQDESEHEEDEDTHDEEEDDDGSDEFDDDDEDEDEKPSRKRGRRTKLTPAKRQKKATPSKPTKAKAKAEDEDEHDDGDDDDDVRERKITVVPIPKLRELGGVDYEDDRLHKNTMLFLKDLRANNNRPWLKSHDAEYRRSLKDWQSFVETLTEKVIEADPTIPELPFKDVNFRIHRDIRFSKDPTPYKPHYSVAWSRTGRKGPYACYYIHCEPGNSFVGGGLWHPEAPAVQQIRESIDERPHRWRRVLNDERFKRVFFPDAVGAKSDETVLKLFASKNKEGALKTKPKNFIADHRDIELLKLKSYTVSTKVDDKVFTSPDGQDRLAEIVGAMCGFVTFLNNIVMPDPNMDDDSSEDE